MGNRKQHGWIQVLADGKTPASGAESRLCGFCLPLSSLPSAQVSASHYFPDGSQSHGPPPPKHHHHLSPGLLHGPNHTHNAHTCTHTRITPLHPHRHIPVCVCTVGLWEPLSRRDRTSLILVETPGTLILTVFPTGEKDKDSPSFQHLLTVRFPV